MTTQPHRSYITVEVAALVVLIVVIVGAIGFLSVTPRPSSSVANNSSAPPGDFSLEGPVPLVTITPENHTFTLTYNATTLSNPVTNLSFSLNQSYVTTYSSGTEWVPYAQACGSSSKSSPSSETATSQSSGSSVSVVTVSANSCGYPATLGWAPVNGVAFDQYAKLNSSQVELSVLPTAVAADKTVSLQFTITLNLKPGVYDIGLGLGVQTTSFFEFTDLNPFPVIVKS
jgi:hypothetical protein